MPHPTLDPETPLFIVFNATSGAGDARTSHDVMHEILANAGRKHEFFAVRDPSQLADTARRAAEAAARVDGAVVVAGGDGTINCVAAATLPLERPFGIVPQGTFNYSGRAHQIPLDTAQATRSLLTARLKPVQVGLLNERVFVVNASLGMYPQLLQDREAYKRQYGRKRSVALLAAVHTMLRENHDLTLTIDHDRERELVRTSTLFVGNNPLQLAQVGVPEADSIGQRQLAAIIVRPVPTPKLFWLAARGAFGRLAEADDVRNFAFRTMTVSPTRHRSRRVKVATDGEIHWMKPPLAFSVAPQPLHLMAPAEEAPAASADGAAA